MKAILIIGVILLLIGIWFFLSKSSVPESDIISRNGIHWHSNLIVKINGEVKEIPENVGMFPRGLPIHTHAKDGVIHMEFTGKVLKDDIRLGRFFEIWGKTFNKDCIFDKCVSSNNQLTMLINGQPNYEFENYIMQDGDKIEIIFEQAEVLPAKEITVSGTEYSFNPSNISLQAGESVKIVFNNQGRAFHNLIIEGLGVGTELIGPGQTDAVEFVAPAFGTYTFLCSVPGHRASGMEGSLIVE